jgi:hypothetical protein
MVAPILPSASDSFRVKACLRAGSRISFQQLTTMNSGFNTEVDFEDGTNIVVGTAYRETELVGRVLPDVASSAPRHARIERSLVGLIGDGLFPRLPTYENWPLLDSIPNDGGHPMAWEAKLTDVVRASVAAIDEILERARKTANILHPIRTQTSRLSSLTTPATVHLMKTTQRDKVFVSYSHKDKKALEEFKTMLAPAIQKGIVDLWDDTKIQPGQQWRAEIETALAATKVAVLLVSKNFLSSEFITQNELPPLLNAAKSEGATIFWVCLSPCLHDQTEIANYQAAHDVSKPLSKLSHPQRDSVWQDICKKLLQLTGNPK